MAASKSLPFATLIETLFVAASVFAGVCQPLNCIGLAGFLQEKEVSKSQVVLGNGSQTSSSLHVRTAYIPTAGTNGLLAAQGAHRVRELILTVVPELPGSFPSMRP